MTEILLCTEMNAGALHVTPCAFVRDPWLTCTINLSKKLKSKSKSKYFIRFCTLQTIYIYILWQAHRHLIFPLVFHWFGMITCTLYTNLQFGFTLFNCIINILVFLVTFFCVFQFRLFFLQF